MALNMCILFFIAFAFIKSGQCSDGDRSKFYNDCLTKCQRDVCDKVVPSPVLVRILNLEWTIWSCTEECEYDCQWKTVDSFKERKWRVPQFKGKWPFIRVFGLQEPASAIFSSFNFLIVLNEFLTFQNDVHPDSPYYNIWIGFSIVCMNCWIWSTVFHTRDTDITERLDYISASALVFTSFYCMTVRIFNLKLSIKTVLYSVICGCILLNHIAYLWFFPFDYAYNMQFNIIVGSLTVAGWMIWSCIAIKQGHPCSILVAAYCVLMAVATLLELIDFPPYFWIFDAHALWHLSTCFIIQIFYTFIRQDCNYLWSLQGSESDHLKTD